MPQTQREHALPMETKLRYSPSPVFVSSSTNNAHKHKVDEEIANGTRAAVPVREIRSRPREKKHGTNRTQQINTTPTRRHHKEQAISRKRNQSPPFPSSNDSLSPLTSAASPGTSHRVNPFPVDPVISGSERRSPALFLCGGIQGLGSFLFRLTLSCSFYCFHLSSVRSSSGESNCTRHTHPAGVPFLVSLARFPEAPGTVACPLGSECCPCRSGVARLVTLLPFSLVFFFVLLPVGFLVSRLSTKLRCECVGQPSSLQVGGIPTGNTNHHLKLPTNVRLRLMKGKVNRQGAQSPPKLRIYHSTSHTIKWHPLQEGYCYDN